MSQPPLSKTTIWTIILGIFSIALLCGIAASLLEVWRADRATMWPTTNGFVVESRLFQGCGRKRTGYLSVVRYSYQVGGIAYESQRIVFGAASCNPMETAKAITDRFPVAAVVKVSFDPQAPAVAVLIPGKVDESTPQGIVIMSLWFLIAAAATGMVGYVARSERRPNPNLPPQRTSGERR